MKIRTAALFLLLTLTAFAQTVRIRTTQGDIDVQLLPQSAPLTVANFLNYVNKGAYSNSFFHRSVRNFIIQGGGFKWQDGKPAEIPQDPAVKNEYSLSNTRGTIAMAKLETGPDTATNQWFFNLGNNSANLNFQNGGFTVFGRINSAAGLAVMDRIAALGIYDAGSPYDAIPLANYSSGDIKEEHLVRVLSIDVLVAPSITPNGIITASAFGAFPSAAPGSYIEIYGSNLTDGVSRGWTGSDFIGDNAPTLLDRVSVAINGQGAYVNYISPGQINVQVPAGIPTGGEVPVIVSKSGVQSAFVMLPIKALSPGLLAPPSLKVGDKQYVYAGRADGTFATTSAPAKSGDTFTFYGTGFGPVTPATTNFAGQIVRAQTTLANPIEFKIGGVPAQHLFAGLAPGLVGVYQFNVTVPPGVANGDAKFEATLNGAPLEQSLLIPVQN